MTAIGIHDLELASAHYALDLADLATAIGVDPDKYRIGLGQLRMSVLAPDEDTVTLAAAAAQPLIQRHGVDGLRAVLLATESGVDQSKAAAVFVHQLLGLPAHVRAVEFKQACYAGTAALQAAIGLIAREPDSRVLVIATDVAKYDLGSPGEPTQGAGAIAMLISASPGLVEIEPVAGVSTTDVDDFWRPNDSTTAVVDGALSISAYLTSLTAAWDDYHARGGAPIWDIDRFLYHQPFTRMARKAHTRLAHHTGAALGDDQVEPGLAYNREIGNSYTAALYLSLAALLDAEPDLGGRRAGFFSYGSGSVGEFFTGIVQPGYRDLVRPDGALAQIARRTPISVPEYRELHGKETNSAVHVEMPRVTTGPFRFAGISGRARHYEAV